MATEQSQDQELYPQVEAYDWDNDPEFQGGLQAILGSASSPEQVAHLTLRARCFYYSRKFGTKVDFDGYQAWRSQHLGQGTHQPPGVSIPTEGEHDSAAATVETEINSSTEAGPMASPHGNAPTPASFAEICQLIAEGKPIPGIKEIPDTVLEGQATTSSAAKRRKPWEKDVPEPESNNTTATETA